MFKKLRGKPSSPLSSRTSSAAASMSMEMQTPPKKHPINALSNYGGASSTAVLGDDLHTAPTPPPSPPALLSFGTEKSSHPAPTTRSRLSTPTIPSPIKRLGRRLSLDATEIRAVVTSTTSLIASFWVAVTLITVGTFVTTLFAIVYLNYNEATHPGTGQVDLIGTSINHMLTVHSASGVAEVRMLSGFDKRKTVGWRVGPSQQVELYREHEDENLLEPMFGVEYNGKVRVREDFVSGKTVMGTGLYATGDGFHFPDGSVMTTAAASAVGVKSEKDINILAGANNTESESAILMSVAGRERMRIKKDGVYFRKWSETVIGEDDEKVGTESYDESISLYPERKELNVGSLQLHAGGLRNMDTEKSVSLYGSGLVLNDTSSNSNGASIYVADSETGDGRIFLIKGQRAIEQGGDAKLAGGDGGVEGIGGDCKLDGGYGGERMGDVVIGAASDKTTIVSNKTDIEARTKLKISSGLVSMNAPVVFENPLVVFSTAAIKRGGGLSMYATIVNVNATVPAFRKGEGGDGAAGEKKFHDIRGNMESAYTMPQEGGVWMPAERCTSCIGFGAEGGWSERYGTVSMLVEGLKVTTVGNGTVDRVSVSCGVFKIAADYGEDAEISDVYIEDDDVVLMTGGSFWEGDDFSGLSGGRVVKLKGGDEYGVLCRGMLVGGEGRAIVSMERVSLSIVL